MEKLIIYRDFGGLKVTAESNYNVRCADAHKITDCSAFESAEDVREYFVKYFGSRDEDFIDLT